MSSVMIRIFDTPNGTRLSVRANGSLRQKVANGSATGAEQLAHAICEQIFNAAQIAAHAHAIETGTQAAEAAKITGWWEPGTEPTLAEMDEAMGNEADRG